MTSPVWPPSTAVVVGGASGMGGAIATQLRDQGVQVLVADRNHDRLAQWPGETFHVDATDDNSVTGLAQHAQTVLGAVDLLVYTPGVAVLGPPHGAAVTDWQAALDVNLLGAVRLVNAFLPSMLERGHSRILLTGSEAGYRPQSWTLGIYGTTKAAINAYAENLAVYCRGHGVQVSLLCPGLVESNFGESARMVGVSEPAAWASMGPRMRPITATEAGRAAIDGLAQNRFLILTHPEFASELADRGRDLDQAIFARADEDGISSLP